MDPVTKDTLTNASRLAVLVPSGEVVLRETYKACIQDEGQFNGGPPHGSLLLLGLL
jgi:nitric oxide synthase-interacting protein